jgi:integrase/recombinase XerC
MKHRRPEKRPPRPPQPTPWSLPRAISEPQDATLPVRLPPDALPALPPVLAGRETPDVLRRVEGFYLSVAEIFERWVARRESPHTQRAYRRDVMGFVVLLEIRWPEESYRLLAASIADVLRWRDRMIELGRAPKTINRRISSLSSFYKYLGAAAAELRLPITVPNPAHAQFVGRQNHDPVRERVSLTATRARQLKGMPAGDTAIDARDRAILKVFLYTGARIGTVCRLDVSDFHEDGEEATLRLSEKGGRRRTIGIHFEAAQAIREYLQKAGISSGPLFRPQLNSRSSRLGEGRMLTTTMYQIVQCYLAKLPGAVKRVRDHDGNERDEFVYTPHSLRATTATLLLDAGVDIMKVKELLGHRHVTTTQIYDKRRRTTRESASHDVPI